MTARFPTADSESRATLPDEVPAALRDLDPTRAEFLRELGVAVRGLSAIFWGLPLTLLAFARHFLLLWPTFYDLLLPIVAASLVLFGACRLAQLRRQERVWQRAILTTQILALILVGLSPFLFLWSRLPNVNFYARAVLLLVMVSFALVMAITRTLLRLAAMLPDDTARADAQLFHGLSSYVVMVLAAVGVTIYIRLAPNSLSEFLSLPRQPVGFGRQAVLLLLALVPVAMAMSVTWKLKEVVMGVVVRGAK